MADETQKPKKNFAGTDNVWIKRLGLLILLAAAGIGSGTILAPITLVVVIFAVVAYVIKLFRGFLKSFWY